MNSRQRTTDHLQGTHDMGTLDIVTAPYDQNTCLPYLFKNRQVPTNVRNFRGRSPRVRNSFVTYKIKGLLRKSSPSGTETPSYGPQSRESFIPVLGRTEVDHPTPVY